MVTIEEFIEEVIDNVLFERRLMDDITTNLSRQAINWLKAKVKEITPSKRYIPSLHTQTATMLNTGLKDKETIPVVFVFATKPRGDDGTEFLRTMGGNLMRNGETGQPMGITINIIVPLPFDEREIQELIPMLKNNLRHELEHFQQNRRLGKEEPTAEKPGIHGKELHHGKPWMQQGKVDLYTAKNYFLSPQEIEAFVIGSYKEAKTRHIPFQQALSDRLQKIYNQFPKGYERYVANVISKVRLAWVEYIKNRFPQYKTMLPKDIALPKEMQFTSHNIPSPPVNNNVIDSTGEVVPSST
jgi:hypothetical protein